MFKRRLMPRQPPKWQFWLARIFGERVSDSCVMWRGKFWILNHHFIHGSKTEAIWMSKLNDPNYWRS